MTVATVGEMVHGHTYMAATLEWDAHTLCGAFYTSESGDTGGVCGRPYNEHSMRPPLARAALDKEPGHIDRFGFMDAHKYGCAAVTELCGPCNCGMLDWNVGHLVFMAQKALTGYEDYLRPGDHSVSQISSSEFRTSYAGLEGVHDVTVNGRVIGRWTPVSDEPPT